MPAAATGSDQLLVGLNRTRRSYNRRMRELFGYDSEFPEPGDKLVCLRNDSKTKGLLNGGIWIVRTTGATRKKKLTLNVVPEDDPTRKPLRIGVLPEFFNGGEESLTPQARRELGRIRLRLCAHRAQGARLAMEQRRAVR